MLNNEKFQETFNLTATELWSMSEENFLKWLNSKYVINEKCKHFYCRQCGRKYYVEPSTQEYDDEGFYYYYAKCPSCGKENSVNNCYWR